MLNFSSDGRIRCSLFHLYNILGNPYGRFLTFKRALKLAILGKATEVVVPALKRLDTFIKEWNIGNSEKRELYLTATNILKDTKGYGSGHLIVMFEKRTSSVF